MTQTTNYDLNIVEGSDVVNPLVQTNPNFQTIDTVMKANEGRGIATATEVKSGTNHAITRSVANAVFRFVATSDFRTGDTFSVDGTTVTATLVDGTLPKDRAFVVGTSVLCILDGIRLTFVNCESTEIDISASDVDYDNSTSGLASNKVQGAIDELRSANNILMSDGDTSVESAINSISYKRAGFSGTTSANGELILTGFEYSNGYRILLVEDCTLPNVTYNITHGSNPNYILFQSNIGQSVANQSVTVVFWYKQI